MKTPQTIGLIGAGKLGKAFLRGLSSLDSPPEIIASVRSEESLSLLKQEFPHIALTLSNEEILQKADWVFLGVKPHLALQTLAPLSAAFRSEHHLFSFCARLRLDEIASLWETSQAPHLHRLMANTSMERNEGIFGHASDRSIPEELHLILSNLGVVMNLDESRFDAFTTLTASAPAFVLEVLRGLEAFAMQEKLSQEMIHQALPQMLRGLASMLELNPNLESRIQQIATPNGMTAAGLDSLRSQKLVHIVQASCDATLKKAKSL